MGDFTNLVELYERSIKKYANNPLFGVKRDGRYQWMTYREFGEQVDAFRGALAELGVGEGDTVAIIADNRVEWAVIAYATYGRGASYCPMYESQLEKDWEYIARDSGAKILVAANKEVFEQVEDFPESIETLEAVIVLDDTPGATHSYSKLLQRGRRAPVAPVYTAPDALAGFIYTSGTTGKPKGVLLTNENMCFNVQSIMDLDIIKHEDVSLAFLPWAHSFGQNCELHAMFAMGAAMGLVESVSTIIENMAEVRPTILFAVPRIFNRIHDGLQKRIANEPPLRQRVFASAMANAEAMREQEEKGGANIATAAMNKVFDATVFSTVREGFGGRLRMAVSGGAALSPEVGRFIDNLKIRVYEGYGLTETSPLVSVNLPGARKIGSVGRALDGVDIEIRDVEGYPKGTGEIIVRGPNVMQGYHQLPQETEDVLDDDRAFHTGDLGRVDEDGFLWILGRVKEQYKLENGKYVVPAPIEEALALSPFILQVMIEGTNKPHNVALIVVDKEYVGQWAKDKGISKSVAELLDDPKVHALIKEEVERMAEAADIKGYEKPRKFKLLSEVWTTDNGMLTPKMSLKRRVVMEQFGDDIEALY